jgi:PAS domain S-box-containing protein
MIRPSDILMAKILIVDDLAANVLVVEEMLRGAGYIAVASTTDPRTVIELHRQNRYDLVLLDLQMPGLNGFEVMTGLTELEPDGSLPILVITAEPSHKLRALKAGAKDFITKPFELAEVLARVRNLLEIRLLHRSESNHNLARLENSQRLAGLGDWDYDFSRRRLVWSPEVYRILGLPPDGTPPDAKAFDRLVHPDDLPFVHREKKAAAERSLRVDLEHRIVRPDGQVRHVHQITEIIFDDQCQPLRESGTIRDITERKLAEAAVRQSEERFRFVARAVSDGIWDWDLPANTVWWNDGFLTNFGFAAGEIAPTLESWNGRIHPADRRWVAKSLRRALESGAESWSAEYDFRRKDGSHTLVQNRGHILRDAAGKAIRMVGGMRDLSGAAPEAQAAAAET